MAEIIGRQSFQLLLNYSRLSILQLTTVVRSHAISRCYSQYPTVYRDPLVPRDDHKTILESESFKELEQLPVRAALNFSTSSMFLDPQIMQFIRHVMEGGKKETARRIVGATLTEIKRIQVRRYNKTAPENRDAIELDPVKIFHAALANARPYLTITRIRHGATWYQVPRPITEKRALSNAMKWFVEAGKDKEKTERFDKTLAQELLNAAENKGRVIQKKIELHKLCEANKAYAHFRWA